MNQNAIDQERCLKETPNEHKQKVTTTLTAQQASTSLPTTTRTESADDGSELQEYYRNATTKIIQQQQPLNKFGLNIKKVSTKAQSSAFQYNTTVKTQIARISYGKENYNQISSRSSLKDMDTRKQPGGTAAKARELSQSAQLIENFAKKKQEREQEIKEIQEMLNEIKSPQKTASAPSSEDTNRKHVSESAINNTFDKEVLKEVNESDNVKTPDTQPTATEQSRASTTTNQNCQAIISKTNKPIRPSSYRRSNTEIQLNRLPTESQDNNSGRVSRRDTTARSCATTIANKHRSKSVQLPLSAKDTQSQNRKAGYNPEKARQYMEMQKKQRKSLLLNEQSNKAKIEKEEIKKRLEELKKSTRKLVNKNLQKKEKTVGKNSPKPKLILKPPEKKAEEKTEEETKSLRNDLKTQEVATKTILTQKCETERAKSANTQDIVDNANRSAHSVKSLSETSPFPLIENHKRIGLLRKTENDKDFSFNSHKKHNFDKENQNLEVLTKQLTQSKEKITTEKLSNKDKAKMLENTPKENEIQNDVPQAIEEKVISDPVPGMPESNLKSSKRDSIPLDSLLSKEIPKKQTQKETLDMPYWLKPSSAQVYPYNFIMAVRRKLEAIAQPLDNTNVEKKFNQQTSTTDLNQYIRQKKRESQELAEDKHRKKIKRKRDDDESQTNNKENKALNEMAALKHLKPIPQKRDIIEHKTLEKAPEVVISSTNKKEERLSSKGDLPQTVSKMNNKEKSVQPLQETEKALTPWISSDKPTSSKPLTKSDDQYDFKQNTNHLKQPSNYKSMESLNSEITSNLSSISLQIPLSNTLTEVSSLRTESRRTFIRSNKLQVENSEDEVTSLTSGTFSSPEKRRCTLQAKEFEFTKPRPVSPLSLEKVDKLKIKRKVSDSENEKIDGEKDFTELLEDFNRSLSQVIQVNEQLKSTLDKSQQILSPNSLRKSSDTEKQYSSDFEKSTSQMHTSSDEKNLKKSLQEKNENLKQRKRQLFEIAEKVKPLLKTQNEDSNRPEAATSKDDDNVLPELNFNMDLKSLSNLSQTTMDDKTESTGTEENYIQEELVSVASPGYEKRVNEIEKLKETLKQTILESKEKRREREERHRKIKENHELYKQKAFEIEKSHAETMQSGIKLHSNQTSQNSVKTQSDVESVSEKSQKENSIKTPHSHEEFKSLEKYEKQYKNNLKELYKRKSDSGSYERPVNQQDNVKQTSSDSSKTSYLSGQKEQQKIFAKSNDSSDSKRGSSQEKSNISSHRSSEHTKSLNSKNSSSNNSKTKTNDNISGSHSSTQSELDNVTTHSKHSGHSVTKTTNNNDDEAITSSIAEALQNTYESTVRENESAPLNQKNKLKLDNSDKNTKNFIKAHINRSRGDFQEIISKESHLNDTQFQQAIQVSSQISSTEFAQSADDEITSSITSKPYHKIGSNPPSSYQSLIVNNKVQQNLVTTTSPSKSNRRISIGSDIVRFFNQYSYDCERNETANDSMSESSLNYSNVGLYDKLIQNENNKSQHLMALLKMREKALLDRTKGQIAWLEVQKARYKAKGLISHIAAIKKKQRGILMKMEKEREEIKRLLQTTANSNAAKPTHAPLAGSHKTVSLHNNTVKRLPSSAPLAKPKTGTQSQQIAKVEHVNTAPILRATYELESSQALEELLKKREEDLRRRREHVEHLIQWHRRLDDEEAEVLNLERQLLSYNNVPHMVEQQQKQLSKLPTTTICTEQLTPTAQTCQTAEPQTIPEETPSTRTSETKRASRARKMEKRLKEIDKSLKELSHISASSNTSGVMGQTNNDIDDSVSSNNSEEVDFVRTTGMKLNKLWKRLTSQQIEKFEPNRRYKLCKTDLECLYEEAKMAVLKDFTENEERIAQELLGKSTSNLSSSNSPVTVPLQNGAEPKAIEIPVLNLNFSSGHSEPEEESTNNSNTNTNKQGIYSPSVAEENFKAQELLNSSNSSESSEQQAIANRIQNKRLENNVQMFLALSQRLHNTSHLQKRHGTAVGGLQRSLSDTEISDIPNHKTDKNTTSQMTIATISSQSNSSIATQTHQRSKSSIVEMANIPLIQTQISDHTDLRQTTQSQTSNNSMRQVQHNETLKDLAQVRELSATIIPTRSSVIQSVGLVTPIKSQQTSAEISTISEDPKSSTLTVSKQKSTYSGQVSSKLEDITAPVIQLSHMNALPSYDSVTQSQLKTNKCTEDSPGTSPNDESNLSTDASSYSLNFENITTDKHSSPGTTTNPDSPQNRTITSITYTKDNSKEDSNQNIHSSSGSPLDAKTSASTTLNSTKSKTFIKGYSQSDLEDRILDVYEADFELDLSNATHIEDITIPTFETTPETTMDEDDKEISSRSASNEDNICTKESLDKIPKSDEIIVNEKPSTSKTCAKPSPDREHLPPPPPLPPPQPSPGIASLTATTPTITLNGQNAGAGASNNLMPDIINELELRRHQLILDNEHLKQYEHVTAVPYMYVREIPNKPPPPYVPPAHGSPMTTIFPSEDRIKDITFRRTHELYCEFLKTDYCNEKGDKLPSVMEEQITNIYERIILDICREYLEEHEEILRDGDPTNFHSQLAFFNPPNRLRCIQDAIYKEVRSCLAMDKTQPKRTQIYSVYGQRAKQDHIGKIIIQEMYDEDDRWCNFHREESEVFHLMVEEMINKNITSIAKDVLLEEGGTIDEEEEVQETITEENEANHKHEVTLDENKEANQTQSSSVFVETLNDDGIENGDGNENEEDQTYCVNEAQQNYTVLNKTATEANRTENVDLANNSSTSNAPQTCT